MKIEMTPTLLLAAACLASGLSFTTLTVTADDLTTQIELVREAARTDRQRVVAAGIKFSADESEAFWPLYREYRNAVSKVNDRRVIMIRRYAEHYNALTNEQAEALLKEWVAIDKELLKLKERYIKKFRKHISPVKVMRYFQIENKMDVAIEVELAAGIPLVLPGQPAIILE